jgi:UDP-sugar transporter A1/2/3
MLVGSGVAIVQLAKTNSDGYKKMFFHGPSEDWWEHSIGMSFAVGSCVTSGLAAVWFEMVLKSSKVNLWVMNIQLAILSVLITTTGVLATAGVGAFLKSFDRLALLAVTFSASDGLVIALVMKYADAILKGFATSVAICITALASVLMGDQPASGQLALGCAVVASSVLLYAWTPTHVAQIQRSLSRTNVGGKPPRPFTSPLIVASPVDGDDSNRPLSRISSSRVESRP